MDLAQRTASLLLAALAFTACEQVALMPRPQIDREGRPIERDSRGDSRLDSDRFDRGTPRDEIVGTVERVDRSNNEIRLRTTDARVVVIKYDPATLVYNRDRDVGIDAIRPRDQILVRLSTNSRGEQYADSIRLNDSASMGTRNY
jgi:hypothetical protein